MPIFAQRSVPDYGIPVLKDELIVGKIYFIANFLDAQMLIPQGAVWP